MTTVALDATSSSNPAGPISTPNTVESTFVIANNGDDDTTAFALALTETNGGEISFSYSINGGPHTAIDDQNPAADTPFVYTINGLDLAADDVLTLVASAYVPFLSTGGNYTLEAAWSGTGVDSGSQTETVVLSDPVILVGAPSQYIGVLGVGFDITLGALYGATPYVFSAIGLPAGVSINSSTGVVSGKPTETGNFIITFTVTDNGSVTNSKMTVAAVLNDDIFVPDIPALAYHPDAKVYVPSQQAWTVGYAIAPIGLVLPPDTVFAAPFVYSAKGLPQGLSINSSTGVISGTPVVPTTAAVINLKFVDAQNRSFSYGFYYTIGLSLADAQQQNKVYNDRSLYGKIPDQLTITDLANDTQAVMAAQYPQSVGGGSGGSAPSAPTIIQSAAFTQGDSPFVLGSIPVAGNLLVALVSHWSSGVTVSTGWARFFVKTGNNDYASILYKVVPDGDTASQSPLTGCAGASVMIYELSGADTSVPTDYAVITDQNQIATTMSIGIASGSIALGMFSTTIRTDLPVITGGAISDQTASEPSGAAAARTVAGFHETFTIAGNITATGTYDFASVTNVIIIGIQGR